MSAVTGIGIREFARRDGCDDKLVRRAIQAGRLIALADGTLDPMLVSTGWRKTNRQNTMTADAPVRAPSATRSQPSELIAAPHEDSDLDGFVNRLLAGQFATLVEAERVKENALALKHVLAAQREAGALIEIESAESVVFDVFRASRDAWLNWPARVGALIAADLGLEADKLTEVLTAHVHQHLTDLGTPAANFATQEG
jgi:hypothetical protein